MSGACRDDIRTMPHLSLIRLLQQCDDSTAPIDFLAERLSKTDDEVWEIVRRLPMLRVEGACVSIREDFRA